MCPKGSPAAAPCCGGCCWTLLWVLVLVLLAWPLALLLCPVYVTCLPFKACWPGCGPVVDFLYEGVLMPLHCAENAVCAAPMC